jgi:NADPH-dependent glutamate synthase beta subunit-like oxidoreductase
MVELSEGEYNPRILLEKLVLSPDAALRSDDPWFCAWCYRCYRQCPQGLKLPEILNLMRTAAIEQGNREPWEKALRHIVKTTPLPLVSALVCFHFERAGIDPKETLENIDKLRAEYVKPKRKSSGVRLGKVAVVGSGPAGLSVAYQLGLKGYHVTVFESMQKPGGMLTKCLPADRLPKHVVDREIQFIKDLGVDMKTGVTIGKDLSFEQLRKKGYRAIFVGAGAHQSQKLRIEGTRLEGVVDAVGFLWHVNSGEKLKVGKKVAVIGGGNVAVDAAVTALHGGAEEVTILYRRSKDEMPAMPRELEEAEKNGVKTEFQVVPKRILGEGHVSGIECVRTELGEPDESGRPKATPIEGSEFKHETDMVILAIGEKPDLSFLPSEIELNRDGTVWVNPVTMETSMSGVFAGGDTVTGPASVIEAIRAGKRSAESIEQYLKASRG